VSVPMILSDLERWDARGQIFQGIYLISLTLVPFDLELHAPTRWRPISCPSLTSACLLTSSLRALFCEVARPSFPLYILFTERYIGTAMKMSRYIRSTSKNKLYCRILPIPTSNHNLPGRRLGRRRSPAVHLTCQSLYLVASPA